MLRSACSVRPPAKRLAELGDRYNHATALIHLGDASDADGDRVAARDAWQEALVILEELGHADAGAVRARLAAIPIT